MAFSFNTSWSLKISLISLALLGAEQTGYASCAENDEENNEIPAAAVPKAQPPVAAIERQDSDAPSILDSDLGTSSILPSEMIGEFFQEKSPYLYNKLLQDLLSKENVAHLKKNNMAIIHQLFPLQEDATPLPFLSSTKRLAMASQANKLFTADMSELDQSRVIEALAPLSVEEIQAFADVMTIPKVNNLFTANMSGLDQSRIMEALAPLGVKEIQAFADVMSTPQVDNLFTAKMSASDQSWIIAALALFRAEQIKVIAQQRDNLFKANMDGYDIATIIEALDSLSAEQIKDVSASFDPGDNLVQRLEKIKAYIQVNCSSQ